MAKVISLIDRHSNAVRLVCGFVVGYWARGSEATGRSDIRAHQYREVRKRVDNLSMTLFQVKEQLYTITKTSPEPVALQIESQIELIEATLDD